MIKKHIGKVVMVAALGYFVDLYDLIIFSFVRIKSLTSLGLEGNALTKYGLIILNSQMIGMLIGGIIWGILGDKKGRVKTLFGSIILYSIANFLNAYVTSVDQYIICRFLAGIGLAGELGVGITLVVEAMPKEKRGLGTSLVAGIGFLGGLLAYCISESFDWRSSFLIGGLLGFGLLFLRIGLHESLMYNKVKNSNAKKGKFINLFTQPKLLLKYIKCIAIGIPIWFIMGILITFSDRFAFYLNIKEKINPSECILIVYLGLILSDFSSGFISQWFKSRKKTLYLFFILMGLSLINFFTLQNGSSTYFYFSTFLLGIGSGFWAIFITISAEQFGTNIRSTVSTTVTNFVRGSLALVSLLFASLQPTFSFVNSAIITAFIVMSVSIISTLFIQETFHKDLDYFEGHEQII